MASLIAPGTTDLVNPDAVHPLFIICMSTIIVKAAVVAAAVTPIEIGPPPIAQGIIKSVGDLPSQT